jgi:hypothetical protein
MPCKCSIFRTLGVAIFAVFASCLCTPGPAVATSARDEDHLYRQAITLLDSGRNYETAATLLGTAIQADPGNPKYHTALACAYADRAASLSYALCFRQLLAQQRSGYPKDLSDWQAAQADKSSDSFGSSRPILLKDRVFDTKDDGKPLILTDSRAIAEIIRLANLAEHEWQSGVRLSPPGPARAASEEAYGWGLRLLERCQSGALGMSNVSGLRFANDSSAAIWKQLSSATRDDPRNPTYWQGVGDEAWSSSVGMFGGTMSESMVDMFVGALRATNPADQLPSEAGSAGAMVNAYRRSLALNPRNPELWERLYEIAQEPQEPSKDVALRLLRSASDYCPQIAKFHYNAAEVIFQRTPYGNIEDSPVQFSHDALIPQVAMEANSSDRNSALDAIHEIDLGNACPEFDVPSYAPPIPNVFRATWGYWSALESLTGPMTEFPKQARLRDLARQAYGYAVVCEFRHHTQEAIRAADATTGIGEKMAGRWPVGGLFSDQDDTVLTLVGTAIIAIGDHALMKVADMSGDGNLINSTDDRWRQFQARDTAFRKRSRAYLSTVDPSQMLIDSY